MGVFTSTVCSEDSFDPIQQEYQVLQKQLSERDYADPVYVQAQQRLNREAFRKEALLLQSDRDPLDVVLRRTKALLDYLSQSNKNVNLHQQFDRLKQNAAQVPVNEEERRIELFERACKLRRQIAFSNPLLDFDRIVFLKHHKSRYKHMVDQYYGFHSVPGGGVFVLNDPFGETPNVENLLENAIVQSGRLKDRHLENGSFISLELSFDAKEIAFAWTEADPVVEEWTDYVSHDVLWKPQSTYHVFKANAEGGDLVQLTDGSWNDFDPVFLPNGRIAFISERRGGYLRCGLRPDPTYTLYDMNADGTQILPLSFHETHEWHPSVDNDGMIAYTRWDYVDRDSDIAHHIWTCYPDGRDPRTLHGNYPQRRELRPWMEMSIRAIPNSHKYVAVSTPHHGQAYGSIVLIDQRKQDDDSTNQLKRVTPEAHFPNRNRRLASLTRPHKGKHNPYGEVYGTPWPLSEDFYLCVYDPDGKNYGLYLIDSFGNRELLYRDPEIPCLDPIPFRSRTKPPVISSPIDRASKQKTGLIAVTDVYDGDFKWPEGTKISALRVVQIFPKTTPAQSEPNIGVGAQSWRAACWGRFPWKRTAAPISKRPPTSPSISKPWTNAGWRFRPCVRTPTCIPAKRSVAVDATNQNAPPKRPRVWTSRWR